MQSAETRLGGVYSTGYAVIPAAILYDTSLTPEAKVIYAYLSLSSRSKLGEYTSLPPEQRILSDLGIAHARYLTHRKKLIDSGYLAVKKQQRTAFDNQFTTHDFCLYASLPSNYCNEHLPKIEDASVIQEGILSRGYGIIPREVIYSRDINIIAKAFYCYACIHAAATTKSDRMARLDIQKLNSILMSKYHAKQAVANLTNSGYIKVQPSSTPGYYCCTLLLHRFGKPEEPSKIKINEELLHNRELYDGEQEKMWTSIIEGRDSADADPLNEYRVSTADDLQQIIHSAVSAALSSLKNNTTGGKIFDESTKNNTTENDTYNNYYNINITINLSSPFQITDTTTIDDLKRKEPIEQAREYDQSIKNEPGRKSDNGGAVVSFFEDNEKNNTTAITKNNTTGSFSQENTFDDYYQEAYEQVEGWIWPEAKIGEEGYYEYRLAQGAIMTMAEIYSLPPDTKIKISGQPMTAANIASVYKRLNAAHLAYVMENIYSTGCDSKDIIDPTAYMRTCLYKASYQAKIAGACSYRDDTRVFSMIKRDNDMSAEKTQRESYFMRHQQRKYTDEELDKIGWNLLEEDEEAEG